MLFKYNVSGYLISSMHYVESYKKEFEKHLDCGPPENITNGKGDVSTPGGTVYLQVATYTCIPSYVVMGNTLRTCQHDGAWSGSAPYCGTVHIHMKCILTSLISLFVLWS